MKILRSSALICFLLSASCIIADFLYNVGVIPNKKDIPIPFFGMTLLVDALGIAILCGILGFLVVGGVLMLLANHLGKRQEEKERENASHDGE